VATPAAARPRVVAGLRLLHQVGEGAEGEVWEARDTNGRRRALKLIRPDALVPPEEVERRGRWLLGIDHPALVTVHRCGLLSGGGLEGWGFVEMAFVDGIALDVAERDPHALARLEPLAEALDLLHAGAWSDGVPLVHRDVKPANLIEDPDGELVLVDASTLRDIDDGMRTRIGTPLFAAPEVVTGRAGPLADVFSFAATAVALLTGARRRDLADLLADPASLDVPAGLRAALEPDPIDRPVSCRAALDARLPLIVGSEVGWTASATEPVPDPRAVSGPPSTRPGEDRAVDAAWLPSATEVLLEPWRDPYTGRVPRRGGGGGWLWLVLLLAVGAVPLLLALQVGARADRLPLLAGTVGVHLVACLVARRGVQGVLAPPLAWASLLAERFAPPGPLAAWARTGLLGCAAVLLGAGAAVQLAPSQVDPVVAAGLGLAGGVGVIGVAGVAGAGRFARLLLVFAWVLGAAIAGVLGVALVPLAALTGRLRVLTAFLASTAGSLVAFVRR
jgi:serine/threonine-protein kinase